MNGSEEEGQLVAIFQAGHRVCAIPASQIVEIMRPLPIEPLAATPDHVLGLSVIRGASIPVVDAGVLLGGQEAPSTRFILLRVMERSVALAVEEVLGVRALPQRSLQALPPLLGEAGQALIDSIGNCDGAFLLVLRTARLLADLPDLPMEEAHGRT